MARPKRPSPEPVDCDPLLFEELEDVVKRVLLKPFKGPRSENRKPTQRELGQRWKLKKRYR